MTFTEWWAQKSAGREAGVTVCMNHIWDAARADQDAELAALRATVAELRAALADARDIIGAAVLGLVFGHKPGADAEAEINRVVDRANELLARTGGAT